MAAYDNKPLDGNGLSHLWAKIKATFAAKAEIPAAGSTTPVMDGTGATGTSAAYARADHVHPTDTSRAPLASPTFTGTPKAPTAEAGTNTTQIATTAFVKAAVDAKADSDTTYTLSGALSSHKVTSTLTPSSGTATTSDFTLAAGTGITITDDATNRKMTIATTAEANQNAFSNVKVGSTTIAADAKQDTLTLAAGSNITLTPDATNDKVTIAATDTNTTYILGTTGSGTSRKVTLTPSDGTTQSVDVPDTNTTYSDFTAPTSSAAGTHGLVPAPAAGELGGYILTSDYDWEPIATALYEGSSTTAEFPFFLYLEYADGKAVLREGPDASTSAHGLMSAADKTKLNGIATGAEVNQNAFSNVKVGSTTVAADAKTDTLELVAGSNVTLTPDATNDKITIAATDTTYSDATTSTHGLMSKTDKGKLDTVSYNATAVSWNESTRVLTITEQTTSTGGSTANEVQIPSSYTHPSYTEASAAAVKVGRDATGHVVIGDALTASDVGASATGHKHAAGDITSGTLGVARGGTGASTLGAGVVYHSASGTGALSIATAANLVSAIGTNAVARATADASGNNIADTYAKKSEITGVYKYKGSVAAEANLPASPSTGDVYNIESASTYGAAGANVAWNGTAWDSLGEVFALDPLTNSEIDAICV